MYWLWLPVIVVLLFVYRIVSDRDQERERRQLLADIRKELLPDIQERLDEVKKELLEEIRFQIGDKLDR